MTKMVVVTWRDHASHRGEWDGDEPLKTMLFQSVGWLLLPRGDGIIRIAMSWDAGTQQYSDILALEEATVESVVALRREGSKKGGKPAEADLPPESPFLGIR